jgi:cytochrome P450
MIGGPMSSTASVDHLDDQLSRRITRLIESRPEDIADPYPLYEELLERSPVHRWGPSLAVARFADIKEIAKDAVTFSNRAYSVGSRARTILDGLNEHDAEVFREVSSFEAMYISRADGEQHDRLRQIAHRAFTPRKMAELSDITQRFTDQMLDRMLERGQTDFVEGLSSRLPMAMINSLLNVPLDDSDLIRGWTARIGKNRGGQVTADLLDAHAALNEFRDYVAEIVAHHRASANSTDLVTALMGAAGEERLSNDELLATMVVLLFAGSDTTTALLGNGLHALLTHRDQWELLLGSPAPLMPTAVEELARYISPVQTTWRVTTAPTRIGELEVDEGTTVLVLIGAANRDPAVFENPNRLDVQRHPNQHIGFWFGAHFCLGAALARLEALTVFTTLVRRFPELRLIDGRDDFAWRGNIQFRTLASLDVDFGV